MKLVKSGDDDTGMRLAHSMENKQNEKARWQPSNIWHGIAPSISTKRQSSHRQNYTTNSLSTKMSHISTIMI